MNMNRKWMMLFLLILGAMIASGCAVSKERMMAYNEAKETFQKATQAGAKKCAPCQYATAEASLAMADHGIQKRWYESAEKYDIAVKVAKEKSLEALKLTPCEKPAPPPPPPAPTPPPPAPAPPPPPPPPPPKPAPVFENIYFNENKTNIDPVAAKALDRDGAMLKENPDIKVEIGGHTDSLGSEKANQKISEKRAESVKKYLMDKFNIPGDRMIVKGYGSKKPIADNGTKEGRVKNRRVELKIIP
jgi:outer membrane protein OmpA-like peptidoglycan-associated protein